MVYELLGFNTDSRYCNDIRWREYTTSKRKADRFDKIRKIQFSDSGHGIVFSAQEHHGPRRQKVTVLYEYVSKEMARLAREEKWPFEVRAVVASARRLVERYNPEDERTPLPDHRDYDDLAAKVRELEETFDGNRLREPRPGPSGNW
jgi:hypothetical protein